MPDVVAHWVEKLTAKPLPALREGIQQVRVMLDSPAVDHLRLSNFIEFDPGFCVHVFRAMNRLPKRPKEIITKLSVAIPMLGMERMSTATRELKAAETVLKKKPFAGLVECFSRAAHAAIYAQILAQRREAEAPSEYAVAALLHDIGEMALWVHSAEQIESINLRTARGEPRDQVARELLGCTIEQISEGISRTWELPALTIQAQDLTNSYLEAPLTVMLAATLARSTAGGWNTQAARDDIELFGEFLDMENDAANGYAHTLAAEAARRLSGRGFLLPAFSLIQQQPAARPQAQTTASPAGRKPSPAPNRVQTAAGQKPAPPVRSAVTKTADGGAQPSSAPSTRQGPSPGAASAPVQAAAGARPSLAQTISGALHAMRDQQQLSRLMFATITPDRKGLQCRLALDIPTRPSLKGFALKFDRTNLFTALLKKSQTFWLNDDNRGRYLPLVPPQTRGVLNEQGFLLMSVFMKNRPVGILYADNGDSDNPLTADSYAVFKTHGQRLVKTLNRSF